MVFMRSIIITNCSRRLFTIMAMCLSGFFVHGFLPGAMLSVVLVPVIKDKCGKINSKDNSIQFNSSHFICQSVG